MTDKREPGSPLRVLHATEAMGGGIVSIVDSISRRQVEAGASVTVLYTVRPDTPSPEVMRERFHPDVSLREPLSGGSTLRDIPLMMRELRRLARRHEYDVIHLHSSIAGVAGRLALVGVRASLFYSPHGFAFLRESSPALVRSFYRTLEQIFARKGTLIVTSAGEVELARERLRAPRVEYLQSGVPESSLVVRKERASGPVLVTMTGRITYQKAPWRFAAVARALEGRARFLWVGGGSAEDAANWIGDAPVELREWATPDELEDIFADTDIFLFPTLWEGMALSLIQAQGRGIPAVTTDVVGNRDTVLDGVTGFVRDTDEQLIEATRRLIDDPDLRRSMGAAAVERVRESFTDDGIGEDSVEIYRRHRA
ncbi:glycosyltransferase [Microbacterium betulae]|uniref:D-inositol 3-phosphate glycosyltransferase n=1 Tax=Microbacterium betulae TaxID=2981139 RepID=A0AA97FIW2_9MICO|nr:glycosyltransferase [Microbacterium sp. AB]WOF22357.1 glycosyltransferase [Microbacterium sp. AB]